MKPVKRIAASLIQTACIFVRMHSPKEDLGMESIIVPFILGIMISIIGIVNMTGNISTLHWYHRSRVKEEDRLPFGRLIGLGTILMGCSVSVNACFEYAALKTGNEALNTYGTLILTCGLGIGAILIIYALFRYNKGIL